MTTAISSSTSATQTLSTGGGKDSTAAIKAQISSLQKSISTQEEALSSAETSDEEAEINQELTDLRAELAKLEAQLAQAKAASGEDQTQRPERPPESMANQRMSGESDKIGRTNVPENPEDVPFGERYAYV